MFSNGAEVTSYNGGRAQTIRIVLDHVRHCPRELEDNAEDLSLDRLEELGGDNCMEDSISEVECTNGQDPMSCPTTVGMLMIKWQKKGQIPVESVIAGRSRKRGDPCPEDRTAQGWGYVTVKLHSKLLKVIVYNI